MRAQPSLHTWLEDALPWCHATRLRAVAYAADALVNGSVLTVTGMGRSGVRNSATAKSCIKRVDRLVGNPRLQEQVNDFSSLLARKLIGKIKQPLLLVDWTPLWGNFQALTAALPGEGRALLVYWEVHNEKSHGKASVHRNFLQSLAKIVPRDCTPTIITDAGFHAPWFKAVRALGWHYIGRVRAQVKCLQEDLSWVEVRSYHSRATPIPKDLGTFTVSRSNPIDHRLVLVRKRMKPGPKKRLESTKQKPGPQKSREKRTTLTLTEQTNRHRKRETEPWVLATSLELEPHKIVKCYKLRMQTEETYRYLKSARYGWAMEQSATRSAPRIRVLLLLAAITSAFLMLVGVLAEADNLQRRYQANTETARRVLSLFVLATLVLQDGAIKPGNKKMKEALAEMNRWAAGSL